MKLVIYLMFFACAVIFINEKSRLVYKSKRKRKSTQPQIDSKIVKQPQGPKTITNRKVAEFDFTDYNFDISRAFNLSSQRNERLNDIKDILKSIVRGQEQTERMLMTFYSHDEFDHFDTIQNGDDVITRRQVERQLMLENESYKIKFPFAIELTRNGWKVIHSHQLANYLMTTQFTSVFHTYSSEIGWYAIYQNRELRRKLMTYRVVGHISQKVIDKFVSLVSINETLKPFNLQTNVNIMQIIEDLRDDDLILGQNLDDFRDLNDEIVFKIQKTINAA